VRVSDADDLGAELEEQAGVLCVLANRIPVPRVQSRAVY